MKVFLCHQAASKPFVRDLAFRVAQVGIESWVDEAEIGPGESLVKRIAEGIHEECDALIACVSRKALGSEWVRDELDQGKYAEIMRPSFQLMVIILEDVSIDELPAYLHNKKHLLWEKDRPDNPEITHPGYAQIIRQLFKGAGGVHPDEAAQDASRLLDRFLHVLYSYGGKREVVRILGSGGPMIFGEIRRDLSHAAIHAWSKYSEMPNDPLTTAMKDLVSSTIHADVAVKDWALGYAETDFQEAIIADFRATLDRLAASIGIAEIVGTIKSRLDLQRRPDMAILYEVSAKEAKPTLLWATDVAGQFYRFGLYNPGSVDNDEFQRSVRPLVAAVMRDPYLAWRTADWPYPSTSSASSPDSP